MFDAVNHLFYNKSKKDLDPYVLEEFNPRFITKVFSFYDSGKYCQYVNDTLNTYLGLFKTKEEEFKFFEEMIPELKKRKWEYIKKDKVEEKDPLPQQYIPDFFSKREIDFLNNICK